MEQKIDALILAGTKNCPRMRYSGGEENKPYIELCGKTAVEHVIDAALESPRIRRAYVVTDSFRLKHVLGQKGSINERIRIIPDSDGIVANIRSAFSYYILPDAGFAELNYDSNTEQYAAENPEAQKLQVMMLCSDAAAIRSEDITRFIDTADPTADYSIGFANDESLSLIEEEVGEELCLPELKTAVFPFENSYIRTNNMFIGRPLRIPKEIWELAQSVYDNRYLLKSDGEGNTKNWKNIARMFWKYASGKDAHKSTVLKGFIRGAFHFWQMYQAYKTDSTLSRLFLAREDFEQAAYEILGKKAVGRMHICDVAVPTFDIDNPAMLEKLIANDCALFRKLQSAPRHYDDDPAQELKQFVRRYHYLFKNRDEPVEEEEWKRMLERRFDR